MDSIRPDKRMGVEDYLALLMQLSQQKQLDMESMKNPDPGMWNNRATNAVPNFRRPDELRMPGQRYQEQQAPQMGFIQWLLQNVFPEAKGMSRGMVLPGKDGYWNTPDRQLDDWLMQNMNRPQRPTWKM